MTDTPNELPVEVRTYLEVNGYKAVPRIEVKSEPLTYREHGFDSYFVDLVKSELNDDRAARARLERHAVEMERRVNPNRVDGQGGYFSPPIWLIEKFATQRRATRVIADLTPTFPLPLGVNSINLPRLTTGGIEQTVNDLGPDPSLDDIDASAQSSVVIIAGMGDVAMQLLEQSPKTAAFDWVTFKDLGEAYDAQLEAQLIYGSGSSVQPNQQFYGVINVPNSVGVTATSAASVLTGMYALLGQQASRIGNNRSAPPGAWFMTTSRWAWMASSSDQSLRPIVTPDVHPPDAPEVDGPAAVSTLFGWPVYVDDAIPTNLGAGGNQDVIIACRPSDMVLFEGEPRTQVGLEVLSGTLQARISLRRSAAFIGGRYPSGISVLSGVGMIVQSGFTN